MKIVYFSTKKCQKTSNGQSLVELLVAIGMMVILLPALVSGLIASRQGKAQQYQRIEAIGFLKETDDAVRIARENSWVNIASNGAYHPLLSGNTWTLSPGSETINGFTRTVTISDVYRDASGAIASSGGILDPSTKLITNTVSWGSPVSSSATSTQYLTRFLGNTVYTETTYATFSAGVTNGTIVATTSGTFPGDGQVQLGAGGGGDWCNPQSNIISTLSLPKQPNAIIAAPGNAYVGAGDGTPGVAFANLAITDPVPAPGTPSASIAGTYSGSFRTNAVYSDGTYTYLATSGPTNQVIILDISHFPYTQVGTITVPGGNDANGVFVSGNIGYVTSANKLYTYDLTTKTGSHTIPLAQIAMWIGFGPTPQARQVIVVNNYAFVGTANTLFGLQRFKVSNNGTTLKLVGVSNLTWQQSSQGLFVNSTGTRAYIAFNNGGFFPKGFFIVDTSAPDPPSWWFLPNFYPIPGWFDAGATDPRGMTIVPGNRALIVGLGGSQQYQVIDITNENNPSYCGGLSISGGLNGIAAVLEPDGDAYSYIISQEASNQFKIIQGGPGGQFVSSGTFESQIFNPGQPVALNNFLATVSTNSANSIKFQIAATDPVSGSCSSATYSYVGPDASTSSYFMSSISSSGATAVSFPIPFGSYGNGFKNPSQCIRYKAYFNTNDIYYSPILYDMNINYSP